MRGTRHFAVSLALSPFVCLFFDFSLSRSRTLTRMSLLPPIECLLASQFMLIRGMCSKVNFILQSQRAGLSPSLAVAVADL
jgi:hypothetical protein